MVLGVWMFNACPRESLFWDMGKPLKKFKEKEFTIRFTFEKNSSFRMNVENNLRETRLRIE